MDLDLSISILKTLKQGRKDILESGEHLNRGCGNPTVVFTDENKPCKLESLSSDKCGACIWNIAENDMMSENNDNANINKNLDQLIQMLTLQKELS